MWDPASGALLIALVVAWAITWLLVVIPLMRALGVPRWHWTLVLGVVAAFCLLAPNFPVALLLGHIGWNVLCAARDQKQIRDGTL
jgi:hypothetical protein